VDDRVVIFAAGGSGGHLFPGLAIEHELRAIGGVRSVFLCSKRTIDAEILSSAGAAHVSLNARPFSTHPGRLAKFAVGWGASVRGARRAIQDAAGEDLSRTHVVAIGGFVAAPAVAAARKLDLPVTMLNLDAVPGKANRWIASRAACVLTTFDVAGTDWSRIAPIVRPAALCGDSPEACRRRIGLDPDRRTLLVTGGSQGAGSINAMMTALVRERPGLFEGWQVIHQTGGGSGRDEQEVREAYSAAGVPAEVRTFFDNVGEVLRASDLAVSRAGAGSVAEAQACALPTLFMPYPYHKDQHQRLNASPLVESGGAVIADDLVDGARNAATVGVMLAELMNDSSAREAMRESLRALGPATGAREVADAVLSDGR